MDKDWADEDHKVHTHNNSAPNKGNKRQNLIEAIKNAYFGWWIVLCAMLAGMIVYGPGLYCFTLFIPPMSEEFGWSRAATGGLVSVFWVSAPLAVFGGFAIRKVGLRWLIILGMLVQVVCLLALPLASELWVLYVLRIIMGVGKIFVGVGCPVILVHWFRYRLGLAMAIAFAGWHLGGAILAPITSYLLDISDWKTASVALGLISFIGTLPAFFLLRSYPSVIERRQEEELHSRDKYGIQRGANETVNQSSKDFKPRQVFTNPLFWLFISITVYFYLTYGSIIAHQTSFLSDLAFTPHLVASAVGLTGAMAALGNLTAGWLVSKISVIKVHMLNFCLLIIALTSYLLVDSYPNIFFLYTAVCCFGIGIGGSDVTWATLVKSCFGAKNYSYIYGIWYFCVLGTLMLGPIITGFIYDISNSYEIAFSLILCGLLIGVFQIKSVSRLANKQSDPNV